MSKLRAVGSTLVATALSALAVAAPAGAATHSLASVESHVKAADTALRSLDRTAHHNASAAKHLVATIRSQAASAGRDAKYLSSHASARTAAQAAGLVALQYDWDLRSFTKLLGSPAPGLQPVLAQALTPVLTGRSQALGMLCGATGQMSGAAASGAGGMLAGLLEATPTEIGSLSGLLAGGGLSTTVGSLISQALSAASSALSAGLPQLQSVVSMIPAPAQGAIQGILGQLTTIVDQLQGVTTGAGATTTGTIPTGTIPTGTIPTGTIPTGMIPTGTTGAGVLGTTSALLSGMLGGLGLSLPSGFGPI
ncbi:MAG: hypothetical protein ACYC91_16660 [Solirubrobacteraceae bacterium]